MEPRVSILLPVFNAETTLRESLESLLSQTFGDYELIAVDDGSIDGSADLLFEYAKNDKRINIITGEHNGIVETLKTAFSRSAAPYIARMDADDISLPERLDHQIKMLDEKSDVAVVGCLVEPVPGTLLTGRYAEYFKWINELTDPESIALNMFVESPLPHPSVMFRRQPYKLVGGYQDHRWPEDYDLWLRMHIAGQKFAKVPEILVYWRDHPNRTTRNNARYDPEAFFQAKAYYLARSVLENVEEVVVWGAGKLSRQRSDFLSEYGISIVAYVDVDPNNIGQKLRGIPVIVPEELASFENRIILPFVSNWSARENIRLRLTSMGKKEGVDFICCA